MKNNIYKFILNKNRRGKRRGVSKHDWYFYKHKLFIKALTNFRMKPHPSLVDLNLAWKDAWINIKSLTA